MYENRHGRFTAVDPLLASGKSANPQSFNRYSYVFNNPIVNTDPTGLQTNSDPNTFEGPVYVRPEEPQPGKEFRYRSAPDPKRGFTLYTGEPRTITPGGSQLLITSRGVFGVPGDRSNANRNAEPPLSPSQRQVVNDIGAGFYRGVRKTLPGYCKVQSSIPGMAGAELSLSQDMRLYLAFSKSTDIDRTGPTVYREFLTQARSFNMLKSVGPLSFGFRPTPTSISCGWFSTQGTMSRSDLHAAMSGGNFSFSVPVGRFFGGLSKSIPTGDQMWATSPVAFELGVPTGRTDNLSRLPSVSVSGSTEITSFESFKEAVRKNARFGPAPGN